MLLPKSAGKSVGSFIADEISNLDRAAFERFVREYVGSSVEAQLVPEDFQVLFEISDEYLRTYSAVCLIKRLKLTMDWKRREKVIAQTESRLAELQSDLSASIADTKHSVTGILAQSVSRQLSNLQRRLGKEFEAIRDHRRLSESMLKALYLKNLRNSYVARLNSYIGDVALRLKLKQDDADKIIAGVMAAAKVFTKAEREKDELEYRVPMARSRARAHLKKEILDRGEFPVFQTRPKGKNSV